MQFGETLLFETVTSIKNLIPEMKEEKKKKTDTRVEIENCSWLISHR
jgi:hypothetical protein